MGPEKQNPGWRAGAPENRATLGSGTQQSLHSRALRVKLFMVEMLRTAISERALARPFDPDISRRLDRIDGLRARTLEELQNHREAA